MTVAIGDLFDDHRFPSGLALVPVLFYFPIGVALALVRFFIGFHAFLIACLLPKTSTIRNVILRVMCGVLGIFVSQYDSHQRDKNSRVLVANYTTTLDHLAIDLILPNILPSVWDLPPTLMWLLGYTNMGAKQGRETLIRNATSHCQTSPIPILAFPEGASTNGKKGLLKFSVWPFSLNQSVQPIIIQVSRPPFARISPSVVGGRWWIDLFWFMFVPYTWFHIKYLASLQQGTEESEEELTKRAQLCMAQALAIQPTTHTSVDKVEYMKRRLFVQNRIESTAGSGARGREDSELDVMCRQVQEVLPHVPVAVIRDDLALTKDVDLTLTNLLEGRVGYTPLEEGVEAGPSPSPSPPPEPSTPPQEKAMPKSFGKTYKERQMSFEERKKSMIENARRRYLEKHGMIA